MEGHAPSNWNGAGGGTVSVVEEGADRVVVRVAAGRHTLRAGTPLTLRFSLLITPVHARRPVETAAGCEPAWCKLCEPVTSPGANLKARELSLSPSSGGRPRACNHQDRRRALAAHVKQRYFHTKYADWDAPDAARLTQLRANVLTLHQGNRLNPYAADPPSSRPRPPVPPPPSPSISLDLQVHQLPFPARRARAAARLRAPAARRRADHGRSWPPPSPPRPRCPVGPGRSQHRAA